VDEQSITSLKRMTATNAPNLLANFILDEALSRVYNRRH